MMKIKVSIIVAVYNAENILNKCLNSLIGQTYEDIEIICVNDSSTDSSQKIIDEFKGKDSRIVSIIHEKNTNEGGALNDGILAAKGEYVCFVDNDDWLSPEAIELMIDASDNGEADLVACDWIRFYNEKEQILNKNLCNDLSFDSIIKHVSNNGFRIIGCLWKRSIFVNNNIFFPTHVFYDDNAIAMTILCYAAKNSVKYVQKPLYFYTMLPTSMTASNNLNLRKITDRIITTELFLSNLKNHGFYGNNKEYFDFYCLKLAIYTAELLSNYSYGEIKEEYIRNKAIIDCCLPNGHINELRWDKQFRIKYPIISFYILKYLRRIRIFISEKIRPLFKIN